jgi:uncharacterized protein
MASMKAAVLLAAVVAVQGGAAQGSRQAAAPQQPAKASPDCATATAVGELVCSDAQIARLDVELARLYRLALSASDLDTRRKNELEATQRGWTRGRDDCRRAVDGRQCVADGYVLRIHELRQGHANTRTADAAGISRGPFVSQCRGLNELLSIQFVDVDPPMASLLWLDTYALVLTAGPGGSDTRYARKYDDGEYVYWEKGGEALFQAPGRKDAICRITESG